MLIDLPPDYRPWTGSGQAIDYPSTILWAMDKEPAEFEVEARLLLALKLYESGRLSTELAAQLAGLSRFAFVFELGKHGLSPFGETAEELAQDIENARRAVSICKLGGGMKFTVTLDRDEDGVWIVECPAIPECVSQGQTKVEALDAIKEAIQLCLEVRAEYGLPLTVEIS